MAAIVFVFPGQGSQYVGMGKELAERYPEAAAVFQEAAAALGRPLEQLCFYGPAADLTRTENTQPAVLTVSIACYQVLAARGIRPAAVAGHSLGEYSALVAAGSLSFSDAVRLVEKRAQFMAAAVPAGQGGMVAILGLEAAKVDALCREVREGTAEAANLNAPGQVVVAGDQQGLTAISSLARAAGAKRVIPLQVSGPFHSRLMALAAQQLAEVIAKVELAAPRIPLVANATADYSRTAAEVRENLIKQVASPVRWQESIERLLNDGCRTFIEVGPGDVLSGLIKRTSRQAVTARVDNIQTLEKTLAILQEGN